MSVNVYIDNDVILDVLLDRKDFVKDSSKIFSLCKSGKIQGYITPLTLCNTNYLFRKVVGNEKSIEAISKLVEFLHVCEMNIDTTLNSISSKFNDFEDAMQYYAVINHGNMDYIITRNKKDFTESEIEVLSLGEFLAEKN